ncbi:hypothetical protein GGX14DRAFT_571752 [Mycena pura]|uniref:Uncharacterized protein n=1 Tax=Mycena pura TaxID=153505 RepID=A0AAD6V695_9AGAR|nr:hypothetical protein GGX14DRAFT_571752 [Mycena pura]
MHFFSVAYILCAVVLAAVAAPVAPKPAPPPPEPSSAPAPAPAASGGAPKAHAPDQFAPLKIVNETLPHIGIEDEAHPKPPHGSCVVA